MVMLFELHLTVTSGFGFVFVFLEIYANFIIYLKKETRIGSQNL